MESIETKDPEKKRLLESSHRHRRELEMEVNDIREKTERVITNVLVIGGSLALAYFVISKFTGSKSNKKKGKDITSATAGEQESTSSTPSLISQIGYKIINEATLLLLDIAREKLNEYLQSRQGSNENS